MKLLLTYLFCARLNRSLDVLAPLIPTLKYQDFHYGLRTHDFKLIYYYGEALGAADAVDESRTPEWELFDLRKDPSELKNVYHDPAYQKTVQTLKEELYRLKDKVGDYE